MKKPLTLTVAALALAGLAACNADKAADNAAADTAAAPAATDTAAAPAEPMPAPDAAAAPADPAATPPAGTPPTGEALGWLQVVNEHEIAMGEQARAKKVDGKVLEYADMMIAEHGKNRTDTNAVAGTASTPIAMTGEAAAMKAKGEAEKTRLAALDGDAYEKAYVDAMVAGHTEVLAMLDRIAPTASPDAVKQHLTMTRDHVAKHLEAAKALQTP